MLSGRTIALLPSAVHLVRKRRIGLTVAVEANPNPNSLKFVTDRMLVDEGVVKDYPDKESTKDSPIAKKLFSFDYLGNIYLCIYRLCQQYYSLLNSHDQNLWVSKVDFFFLNMRLHLISKGAVIDEMPSIFMQKVAKSSWCYI